MVALETSKRQGIFVVPPQGFHGIRKSVDLWASIAVSP